MARRGRPTVEIVLSGDERKTLERWARRHSSSQALALRCRIVLACAAGGINTSVAAELGVHPTTVSKWRHRFAQDRLDGLVDAPRPGAARTIGDDVIEAVVVETLETAPPDATHWSTRGLAAKHGISHTTVGEIWRAFGLKPWRTDSFKVSPDPDLVEKIRDLVALYLNPPVAAAVFAVDEKPQIQALNRTAPTLPMLPTTPQRATHDYERNGTCDLFAALEIATGKVITDIRARHTSADFVAFLNKVDRNVPKDLAVPCHLGQPLRAQDADRAPLAAASPPLPPALHAHVRVVDEPRRTVVLRAHHQEAATLRAPQRQRARRGHRGLGRDLEREPHPLRLAQDRRADPRTPRRLLHRHQPRHRMTPPITRLFSLPGH
jgi:transposase